MSVNYSLNLFFLVVVARLNCKGKSFCGVLFGLDFISCGKFSLKHEGVSVFGLPAWAYGCASFSKR